MSKDLTVSYTFLERAEFLTTITGPENTERDG